MYQYESKLKKEQVSKNIIQRKEHEQTIALPNITGIPDATKAQFEQISGFSFDDVRVNYNSAKPASIDALAYTQGNEVHIAPRQEKHLLHELTHVVQQKQGRVKPTGYIGKIAVNDDDILEKEAESMPIQACGLSHKIESLQDGISCNIVQRQPYFNTVTYNNGATRKLYAAGDDADIPQDTDVYSDIGIMYEMICTSTQVVDLINSFRQTFLANDNRKDVGLSVVVNDRQPVLNNTNAAPTADDVNSIYVAANQNSPIIRIEKVAWGYDNTGKAIGIPTLGWKTEIPYLELRKRAADNPGAQKVHNVLKKYCTNVWRRTGDNDMTFHNPTNRNDGQIKVLKRTYDKRAVTFAYDLVSEQGSYRKAHESRNPIIPLDDRGIVNQRIGELLSKLYNSEAYFRSYLAEKGLLLSTGRFVKAKLYPSEPTTYYKANPGQHGEITSTKQVKEGATIMSGLGLDSQHKYVPHPDTKEVTSAGSRNDALIKELVHTATFDEERRQYKFLIDENTFISLVTSLDQSYFNPKNSLAFNLNEKEQVAFIQIVKKRLNIIFTSFVRRFFPEI